ncbi:MAG: hypothetical protein ACU826_09535 [Gammaproteobacteria bacterium]
MIGGIVILYIAVWYYQAAIKAKKDNAFKWVAIGALTFFVFEYLWVWMNIFSLAAEMEDRSMASIGDRADRAGEKNFTAILISIYLELMPILIGFIAAAVVRTQFVLKEKMSWKNLWSDMNIFKSNKKAELKESAASESTTAEKESESNE